MQIPALISFCYRDDIISWNLNLLNLFGQFEIFYIQYPKPFMRGNLF